jgi:hypothetical protein
MSALRFHPGVIAIALSLLIVATVALAATTLAETGAIGGQLRLFIGAVTGLALVVLANFAILDDEPEPSRHSSSR